jgi:RimJ/RimL family protein N-acetyltransferase
MKKLNKYNIIETLPLKTEEFTIRQWDRNDLDKLASWPKYPFPYETFNFSFRDMSPEEKNNIFEKRNKSQNMIITVVDHIKQSSIGYFAPHLIDWDNKKIANFGLRIMPNWCDKGIGTLVLREAINWLFKCGIETICLDVAASNARAIKCYEKIGFIRTDEIWRDDEYLININLADVRYDFLRPHVRLNKPIPQLCFWLMEYKKNNKMA